MATQFPNDPNADRFIDGLKMTDDGGAVERDHAADVKPDEPVRLADGIPERPRPGVIEVGHAIDRGTRQAGAGAGGEPSEPLSLGEGERLSLCRTIPRGDERDGCDHEESPAQPSPLDKPPRHQTTSARLRQRNPAAPTTATATHAAAGSGTATIAAG